MLLDQPDECAAFRFAPPMSTPIHGAAFGFTVGEVEHSIPCEESAESWAESNSSLEFITLSLPIFLCITTSLTKLRNTLNF
jgi:hypothetical protein